MIVREIESRDGVRTERLVDYSTGEVVSASPPRSRAADAWANHYCLSMGARTPEHAAEIAEKCAAANVSCEFDKALNIRVTSASHQRRLAKAIFPGQNVVNRDSYYG